MFMKRKNAVTAMIVLFICVAVYLNWSYSGTAPEGGDIGAGNIPDEMSDVKDEKKAAGEKEEVSVEDADAMSEDYFTNARLEKQKARDSALTILKETSEKEEISQQERDRAAANMESLASGAVSEARIETLIKAKGFDDCVALINDQAVNVIVKVPEGGLTAGDTTKIKDIVISEAKVTPGQIKIVEIK